MEQAATGRTITYSDFAPKLGVAPLGIGRWLTPPLYWCRRHGLPDLPIIVVTKATGRPRGDYHAETIAEETTRVFGFDWAAVERPDLAVLRPASGARERCSILRIRYAPTPDFHRPPRTRAGRGAALRDRPP